MGIDVWGEVGWGGVGWVFSDTTIAEHSVTLLFILYSPTPPSFSLNTLQIPTRDVCTGRSWQMSAPGTQLPPPQQALLPPEITWGSHSQSCTAGLGA